MLKHLIPLLLLYFDINIHVYIHIIICSVCYLLYVYIDHTFNHRDSYSYTHSKCVTNVTNILYTYMMIFILLSDYKIIYTHVLILPCFSCIILQMSCSNVHFVPELSIINLFKLVQTLRFSRRVTLKYPAQHFLC